MSKNALLYDFRRGCSVKTALLSLVLFFCIGSATATDLVLVGNTQPYIKGIVYNDNISRRLTSEIEEEIGHEHGGRVLKLSRYSSGGRIAFETNSDNVQISMTSINSNIAHGRYVGKGVEVYIDGVYHASFLANQENVIELALKLSNRDKITHVEVYLPTWGSVGDIKIFTEDGALIRPVATSPHTIAYYGSSITQGCCAGNNGTNYPNLIYRFNGVDYYNFGFAGSGTGHIEVIEHIVSLAPSIIVLDYWANPTIARYRDSLPRILSYLSSELPETDILVLGTFYNPGRDKEHAQKDKIAKQAILDANHQFSANIMFVDDLFTKDDAIGLYDGRHLNAIGFYFVASRLTPIINNLLKNHYHPD